MNTSEQSANAARLAAWLETPLGQRVQHLESRLVTDALSQVFGWQLLQIGLWGTPGALLSGARTQRSAVLAEQLPTVGDVPLIRSRLDTLGIASDAVDAVLLPHTLEFVADPHALLREVARILPGDGQLILLGFRPFSLWGLRNAFAGSGFPPGTERYLSEHRVRDWLKLLGFEVYEAHRFLFTWPWGRTTPRGQRFLENTGRAVWPLFAGAYMLRARKRVYALTPIRPRWKLRTQAVGGLVETGTQMNPDTTMKDDPV